MPLVGVCFLISAATVSCRIGQQVWLGVGCSLLAETFSFNFGGFSGSKEIKEKKKKQCLPKFDIIVFILKRCVSQILGKPCVHSGGHSFEPKFMKLSEC